MKRLNPSHAKDVWSLNEDRWLSDIQLHVPKTKYNLEIKIYSGGISIHAYNLIQQKQQRAVYTFSFWIWSDNTKIFGMPRNYFYWLTQARNKESTNNSFNALYHQIAVTKRNFYRESRVASMVKNLNRVKKRNVFSTFY